MTTKLSIITGTLNRPESYHRFIESLNRTIHHFNSELIVSDASDEPGSYTLQDENDPLVQQTIVLEEKPRLGVFKGYNRAFRQAVGEYVVWFNDDCELLPDWDKIAVAFMDKHPEVGMGCLYWSDKKPDGTWRHRSDVRPDELKAAGQRIFKAKELPQVQLFEVQSFYGVIYANFGIVRRSAGEEVGWFDETLGFMYGCDTAFAYELIDRGYAVVPIPGTRVLHHRERDKVRSDNRARAGRDRMMFDRKWKPRISVLQKKMEKFKHMMGPKYL